MPTFPSSTITLGDLPTAERVRVLCSDLYLAAFRQSLKTFRDLINEL